MKGRSKKPFHFFRLAFMTAMGIIICFVMIQIISKHPFFGVRHVVTDQKVVALTYDDGPSIPYTTQILDVLAAHNAKATFFAIGQNIDAHPEVIPLIIKAGHGLGNHSYEHKYMALRPWWYIKNEVDYTDHLLRELGVTGTIDFRPPWGRRCFLLPLYLHQKHKRLIIWDVDSLDWNLTLTPEKIADHVLHAVTSGSIILFHDGGGDRQNTVRATDLVLRELKQQNYQFVTTEELFTKYAKE